MASSDLLGETVAGFLEEVASESAAPGGGAVAALAVAMAASLVEMAARLSRAWEGAEGAIAEAQALRERVAPLAQADADAFTAFLAARRRPADDPGREAALEAARSRIAEVPLEIAAVAAEVAKLAASLVEQGAPSLRGDAAAAAVTASAGARIGATLVEINVEGEPEERLARARKLVEAAAAAAERALAAARLPV
ncbi:MAG: cyclodeaminase/cyclohydrolase family protein [Gaiellaceae bacterium]